MRARLVWTAVALLVAGAAHVRGLCCTGGVAKGSINCPNPFYMSDKCVNGNIRVERRTFNEPNGSTRRDMVDLDCTAPIIVQERVTAKATAPTGRIPPGRTIARTSIGLFSTKMANHPKRGGRDVATSSDAIAGGNAWKAL